MKDFSFPFASRFGKSALSPAWKRLWANDKAVLALLGLGWFVFLTLVNVYGSRQYGFHRDELAFFDNGKHLAWGYVEYPPLVPFLARISLSIFGPSVVGMRILPILAASLVLVLTGWMTRALGGPRRAQVIAGLAAATAPVLLFFSLFFSYETFDYLWWVLAAYLLVLLLKSENPRWWLAIGAVIGLGMLTKYTMAFFALAVAVGVILTPARRYLKSPWLWGGVALALAICLPNLVWQAQHQFISLKFLGSIHARDIRQGRTALFLPYQFFASTNPPAVTLWIGGLYFALFSADGKRYRGLAFAFLAALGVFLALQGRFYYLAPAYPVLIALGASRLGARSPARNRSLSIGLAIGILACLAFDLPLAPVNSGWWKIATFVNSEPREEIGWTELVGTVASIRNSLPAEDRAGLGILTGNYGEAGAVNLYGPAYGLPQAISPIDSYWLRGYGDPPPETLIVIGIPSPQATGIFESCRLAGHTSNRFNILNEETLRHPDIFVCRGLRQPWPQFWQRAQSFG